MEEMKLVFDEYIKLIENGNYIELKKILNDENPANIGEFFDILPPDKQLFVFRLLTKDNAACVFSYMDSDTQEHIVNSITDNEVRSIVDELFMDDTVDFLSEAPANLVTKVLKNTDYDKRELINKFLNYPENSAGSIMTIEFVQFNKNMKSYEAINELIKTGLYKETIYTCYVVDDNRRLEGVLTLRKLILADDGTVISEIMNKNIISVETLDDQEYVSQLFKKYNLIAMPVVDKENRLVGIITVDDIVDVIEKEDTEDIEKMSALLPSDYEYIKTSVFSLAKNRILWLLILMISGTISGFIMGLYDDILSNTIALSAFVPLIMGTGGNAGSQASTLIIRGMALGDIYTSDMLKVIWKEIRVGIISGTFLSVINFIRLMIIQPNQISVNITVSLSMLCVVIVAKSIGSILPIIAKKCNFDPAIMAGPLITTIVDAVALTIFFNISKMIIY